MSRRPYYLCAQWVKGQCHKVSDQSQWVKGQGHRDQMCLICCRNYLTNRLSPSTHVSWDILVFSGSRFKVTGPGVNDNNIF